MLPLGDFNGDGTVNLTNVGLAFQICVGIEPTAWTSRRHGPSETRKPGKKAVRISKLGEAITCVDMEIQNDFLVLIRLILS